MTKKTTQVLIIEGDSDAASLIDAYLSGAQDSDENMILAHAPRLSNACALLSRQDFDAVLLDLALPQTSGLDGFLKLKALKPMIPIILLTGKKDEAVAARGVKLGAQDYFIKGSQDCLLLKRAIRYAIERRQQAVELEALLAADASAKIVVDSDGMVRFANAAVDGALQRTASSLLDKPFGHALHDGAELILAGHKSRERRVVLRVRPISWYGRPARLVTLVADAPVTARATADNEEGDRFLNAMGSRNHFLSRISHELRNTLATMKTAAYCLKEGAADKLTAPQIQMVDIISRNIDRQNKLVENILDLFHFRSGKLKIERREADAAEIIAQLADEYRLSRSGRELKLSVAAGLPRVACDADLIAQVLRNLVDNAQRFAKERIIIEAAKAGPDRITVSVVDDGDGIPEEKLGSLFAHYMRLDGPEQLGGHKGLGLGLAICKEIIEGHQGRIWAENAPSRGARFTFDLPVHDGRGVAAAVPAKRVIAHK